MIKIDETLKSALIRKDVKTVYAIMLDNNEMAEQAEEVRAASRFTKALVDRTCPKVEVEEKFEEPLPEFAEAAVKENEIAAQFKDLNSLIEKGKAKKAKKLFKAMKESGLKGAEMDNAKKAIKEL